MTRPRLTLAFLALCFAASAQTTLPPVQLTAEQDHQRLLDLLHLTSLRPGVSHDPASANPTNFDESKANPWPKLPDPLVLNDGKPVTTAKIWTTERRPELMEFFDREILGRTPGTTPAVRWELVNTTHEADAANGIIPTVTKHLMGHVDNSSYPLIHVDIEVTLTTPAKATGPVPVVLEFTFEKYPRPSDRRLRQTLIQAGSNRF